MSASSTVIADSTQPSAMDRLVQFVAARRQATEPVADLAAFERELRDKVAAFEQEVIAAELERFDLDVPELLVDGVPHRRVLRSQQTYVSSAGPVRVRRTLYRARGQRRALSPLEARAGIVEGFWTERAAELGAWTVAHLVPREAEALFARVGQMQPSRSALDRLPKALSAHWEAKRVEFEASCREREQVPADAVVVAVSLDGVQVPMQDANGAARRQQAREQGKHSSGPAGFREASCATISFYDREGEQISTVRFARMPEGGKRTLKQMLRDEIEAALTERPALRLVKLADGARDNWTYLSEQLPEGVELVDFYHATEHLSAALEVAYGVRRAKTHSEFERLRHALRWHQRGAGEVAGALARLAKVYPRRSVIAREAAYFRANRARMRYAERAAEGLPIGSGVVEAACKTLVAERMKRSGQRWLEPGGQAILTLRSLIQSDRFDLAWPLLAREYRRDVKLPDKVIVFPTSSSIGASI
jgi:hypothetical protein